MYLWTRKYLLNLGSLRSSAFLFFFQYFHSYSYITLAVASRWPCNELNSISNWTNNDNRAIGHRYVMWLRWTCNRRERPGDERAVFTRRRRKRQARRRRGQRSHGSKPSTACLMADWVTSVFCIYVTRIQRAVYHWCHRELRRVFLLRAWRYGINNTSSSSSSSSLSSSGADPGFHRRTGL